MHDEDNYIYVGVNKKIYLTVKENKILSMLIRNKGNVVTYEQLCRLIYNDMDYYFKECIRNKVFYLRKKLKGELEILTIRGIGYKIPTNIMYKNYCPFCGKEIKIHYNVN